jgi:hypothetical protein
LLPVLNFSSWLGWMVMVLAPGEADGAAAGVAPAEEDAEAAAEADADAEVEPDGLADADADVDAEVDAEVEVDGDAAAGAAEGVVVAAHVSTWPPLGTAAPVSVTGCAEEFTTHMVSGAVAPFGYPLSRKSTVALRTLMYWSGALTTASPFAPGIAETIFDVSASCPALHPASRTTGRASAAPAPTASRRRFQVTTRPLIRNSQQR